MSINKILSWVGLALLAVATVFYFSGPPKDIIGKFQFGDKEVDGLPTAVMSGAVASHYDADGSLNYSFEAEHMYHFREVADDGEVRGYTTVDQPRMVMYREDSPWNVSARRGRIDDDETIELQDDVIVFQQNSDGSKATLRTAKLTLEPSQKLAYTTLPVTIDAPHGHIEAIGMKADLGKKTIRLLSKVKGVYEP